ncbi:MAG TPA: glycoside hydrolase family 3 C-terminal domain-containing protein [Fimbriimonadaceae bacterium]|nr:glycoside hydrolase family 3 C-terminal domain-containing protein [Fimbriimonadaceae bacterium]
MLASLALCLALQNPSAGVEARVNDLLRQMTIEEKVEMLSGIRSFYTRPIERLHIPSLKMSDGPAGVRTWGKTTAYPAPICLAATWDRDLLFKIGQSYGKDALARGVDVLLAPGVNIDRVPQNGRNFEYYGEDPYLAGETAAQFILGVQSMGVAATVKHYVANNQEFDRTGTSSDVDERTLREIYLPAFEAAVKKGHVWAVMASYNLINGTYASENDWLQNQVLKKEWGFNGVVMSDWGATHSAAKAANNGLDLEMPGGEFFTQKGLMPAVKSGVVSEATIDDKVRRILRMAISIGAFDRKAPPQPASENPETGNVALEAATEGITLLKNERKLLPLMGVKRIAVIGPNADPAVVGGGGSSEATPFHSVSVLDAIRERAGSGIAVDYAAGALTDVGPAAKNSTYDGAGLKAEFFANKSLSGPAQTTRMDRRIDYRWDGSPANGLGKDDWSVRWTGTITAKESGDYEFLARGDDGYRVFLDDKAILDEWRDQGAFDSSKKAHLVAGRAYRLRVEYYQAGGDAEMRFGWRKIDGQPYKAAVEAARKADVAIVCIGLKPSIEHEGDDHPFTLPAGQDELVEEVIRANPKTIVVLNSGSSLDLTKWIDKVPALVMAYYPGQNGNKALAKILFGDLSPSGKLPFTFIRRWEDSPAYGNYPGVNHHVKYAEGLAVGYRYFDTAKTKPLFPFGAGLSYATFRYSDYKVETGHKGEAVVRFTITNAGDRQAAEVAQVYVSPEHSLVPRPLKELKGYVRVSLKPGESREVSVLLDARAFSYYDVKAHDWIVAHGTYRILVGSSSQDIRLRGTAGR